MPELENQVAAALGLEPEQPEAPATPTEEEQPVEATEQTTTEQTPQQVEQPVQSNTDNSTIRQMREQIAQEKREKQRIEALLQRMADQQGKTVEQLEADLQINEDKKTAQSLNIPQEVATRMRIQEEQIKQLREESIRNDFNYRYNNFKQSTGLSDDQALAFLRDVQGKGFDPLTKGMDLTTLYRAVNFEALSQAKEAELKQKILNEMYNNPNANTIPATNSQVPSPKPVEDNPKQFVDELFAQFK